MRCCSSKRRFYPAVSAGDAGRFVLKWLGMTTETSGITGVLARAWRAVAKAFTPVSNAGASQQYGADTTLFGASTHLPRERGSRDGVKNEFWVPSESTDFADIEGDRDTRGRR